MKAPKKITDSAKTKIATKTTKTKTLDKLKPSRTLNFSLDDSVNIEDTEIRITVKGNDINVTLFLKGIPLMQQVVLVKPIPTPPPIKPEVLKALGALKIMFKHKING